jgi:hypothetical protein
MTAATARPIAALWVGASAVVAAWAALLLAESVAIGFFWREQFSAAWEVTLARNAVVPVAIVALAPLSVVAVAGWDLVRRAAGGSRAARVALAVAGAVAASALAMGLSNGRHFAATSVRAVFVAAWAIAGASLGSRALPRLVALEDRGLSIGLVAGGIGVAIGGWLGDAFVLPRLYPAFHLAMVLSSLAGGALVALAGRPRAQPPGSSGRALAAVVAVVVLLCAASVPQAIRALDRASNVRIVLVEHAPLLGRVVAGVVRWRGAPVPDAPVAPAAPAPGEVARALDWEGHDLLLLSVDALRADHVSAYGYARRTTPNVDALAREGAIFESAYCPTPHTSYSITSMMTGKYMRPLVAMGLGADSETWAQDLRRYGWRTAAFYPPAVFYIDEDRFSRFEAEQLGFEYAKVEFAGPALREEQVSGYLEKEAPTDRPLFLWVHFFEPHEPYVMHAEHPFAGGPSPEVDAYDSEVATADDGIGRVVRLVRARRPETAIVVTADHGEEFGEHGGRYHGTTVYEEQVRVPLVVVGPGVAPGVRVPTVVQTIDVMPTALSALGIPRPARLRGRDLGPVLSARAGARDAGLAFAETDDAALVASGAHRLVCERRAAACALYRPSVDPLEHRDVAGEEPDAVARLRGTLLATERDHGRYEGAGVAAWPDALRRGMQGDAEAAEDVAALLDDANVEIRRASASVCFALHAAVALPALARALAHDEDDQVRRWCALAVARTGGPVPPLVEALLADPDRDWRRRAAIVLTERGDGRGCDEMASWWSEAAPVDGGPKEDGEPYRLAVDLLHAKEMLAATSRGRCRSALGSLVRALGDVRARPYVADALGALGDGRAGAPLREAIAAEPYVTTRPHEARALLALGVHDWTAAAPQEAVHASLAAPGHAAAARVVALLSDADASLEVQADGRTLAPPEAGSAVRVFDLDARAGHRVELDLRAGGGGVVALWMVGAGPR